MPPIDPSTQDSPDIVNPVVGAPPPVAGGFDLTTPPPLPSIGGAAGQQTQANRAALIDTILANQIQQVTPFGTVSFTGQPLTSGRTVTQTLSPSGQVQLGQRNALAEALGVGALQRAGQISADPFSLGGLPAAGQVPGAEDFGAERERVEQALFRRAEAQFEPRFGREQESLRTRLLNQGFTQGTEGFKNALNDLLTTQGAQRSAAEDQAILAGGAEQSRLFSLAGQQSQFQSQQRATALQEQLLERGLPFNELSAFLSGSPVQQAGPTFQPFGVGAQSADVIGAQGLQTQADIAAQNRAAGERSSNIGAIAGIVGSLGGAALGSDAFSNLFA